MKRLLVLRLSALGDVIHTIPAVVSLRGAFDITWAVEAPYAELVELVAGVRTVPVRMKRWLRDPSQMTDALRAVRRVEVSVDFQGLMKSAILGFLSGARERYGFASDAIREKPALLFTNRKVQVDPATHVVEQNLALARGVWITPSEETPSWHSFPDRDGLAESLSGSVVLLPGAGKANKLWPVERFRELAQKIGPDALVAWGPGERELGEAIGARMAPPTNLRQLAWLVKTARVVVAADTGPLHLAAALGTRVVGLYGPTDPRRNGPYGQIEQCVDHFRTTKSMDSISVDEVLSALAPGR